ncbi:protein ACCELERATED CELL DEATH 6-like isoform X1 [Fagus crenata]
MLENFPNAISEEDACGWIPLHYAAYYGNLEAVELFLEKTISLAYKKDKEGMSSLHISAKVGHVNVMRTLFTKCPYTLELLDNKGRTALHLAVESGNIDAVEIFLKEKASQDMINEQDEEGNTSLHLAAINGCYEILTMLVDESKVDKWAINKEGKNIADIIQLDNQFTVSEKEKIMLKWNRMKDVHIISLERVHDSQTNRVVTLTPYAKRVAEINITAVTIITSVTFAAAFQVPGGYDNTGKAVLINTGNFRWFLIFDSLAFGASSASILIHFLRTILQESKFRFLLKNKNLTMFLTLASLIFMVVAFCCGTLVVLEKKTKFSSLAFLSGSYSFLSPLLLCYIGFTLRNSSVFSNLRARRRSYHKN